MADQHGASTIKEWMSELVELARSGQPFDTSAGAEPGRAYAYLEFHEGEDHHSILVFRVEESEVRAYRFDGKADDVRRQVDALTHDR